MNQCINSRGLDEVEIVVGSMEVEIFSIEVMVVPTLTVLYGDEGSGNQKKSWMRNLARNLKKKKKPHFF